MRRLLALALAIFSAGCAVRVPQRFRLEGTTLLPPTVKNASITVGRVRLPRPCPADGAPGVIKGRTLQTDPDNLSKQQPAHLLDWSDACGGPALGERIAYSVPLPANAASRLLYSDLRRDGWIDLIPLMRLQVVSPILKAGTPDDAPLVTGQGTTLTVELKASPNVIGFETSRYVVEPSDAGAVRIRSIAVERSVEGERPGPNYFPTGTGLFRLVYKAGSNEYTQILIAGRTRAELDRKSERLEGTPIPRRVAVNVLIPITVNGSERLLHWGSTVADALRSSRAATDATLPKLVMHKPYQGRLLPVVFDPNSREILQLVLTGGESLSWQ